MRTPSNSSLSRSIRPRAPARVVSGRIAAIAGRSAVSRRSRSHRRSPGQAHGRVAPVRPTDPSKTTTLTGRWYRSARKISSEACTAKTFGGRTPSVIDLASSSRWRTAALAACASTPAKRTACDSSGSSASKAPRGRAAPGIGMHSAVVVPKDCSSRSTNAGDHAPFITLKSGRGAAVGGVSSANGPTGTSSDIRLVGLPSASRSAVRYQASRPGSRSRQPIRAGMPRRRPAPRQRPAIR